MSGGVRSALVAAREKIADPARWTRHVQARDAAGAEVDPKDATAVCWCAYGAIAAVTSDCMTRFDVANALRAITFPRCVADVNDSDGPDGHRAILAAFDRAIAGAS